METRLRRVARDRGHAPRSGRRELAERVAFPRDAAGGSRARRSWSGTRTPAGAARWTPSSSSTLPAATRRAAAVPPARRGRPPRRGATAEIVDGGRASSPISSRRRGRAGTCSPGLRRDFDGSAPTRSVATRAVGKKLEIDLRLAAAGGALDLDAAKAELRERIAKGASSACACAPRAAARPAALRRRAARPRAARLPPRARTRAGGARAVSAERLAGGALRSRTRRGASRRRRTAASRSSQSPERCARAGRAATRLGGRPRRRVQLRSGSGRADRRPPRARAASRSRERRGARSSCALDAALRVPLELGARPAVDGARAASRCRRGSRCGSRGTSIALDVALEVDNTARDHRLRAASRAPFAARRFEVESAFEIAERPIAPAPDAFGARVPRSARSARRRSGASRRSRTTGGSRSRWRIAAARRSRRCPSRRARARSR